MYDDPCKTLQELSNVVGKVYNLCKVKTIRVAVVHGYGQLVRPHLWEVDEKFYTDIMFQQG